MKRRGKFLVAALFFVIASCAVITVNIYFPEKDVKEAYKNLEKELMDTGGKTGVQPGAQPEVKPQSSIRFEFATPAYAGPSLAEDISAIVRRMPDVVAAYKDIGANLPALDKLRDRGAVGEANNGLLEAREGTMSPQEKQLVDRMNENRKTVIKGMTKAIVRINRLPETPDNLKQVTPQATEQFASIRRDAAKKGWWIQDAHGNWAKK
ncbi:MAG TPA: DUF1318 domain-containing protein [Dissulfurispiraceae bacterium]